MGLIPNVAKFLGIDKFGQGLASAYRTKKLPGLVESTRGRPNEFQQDIEVQQQADASVQKLFYAARQEKNPAKKARLLTVAKNLSTPQVTPQDIDPGLNLSNKEVIGSAANVALNIATPGAFKGGKAAIVAKNAALGGAFGAASGLEKNRSAGGVIGSTIGGGLVGAGLGAASVATKVAKDFFTGTTPEWMMNHAVKPALNDLKKNVRFGTDTLGKELLSEGVKGGPKRLLEIAHEQLTSLEDELQPILEDRRFADARITRKQILPYLKDIIKQKKDALSPEDVKRIKAIYKTLPEQMTLPEANQHKRAIYDELRDPAYKIDAKLSSKSQTLKSIARGLKTAIENTVGGTVVQDINRKLSIYGRLENSVTDQLARSMRNNAFSLTDALLLIAGGAGTIVNPDEKSKPLGMLAALAAILGRHNSTALYSTAANVLDKGAETGSGAAAQAAEVVARRAILNAP